MPVTLSSKTKHKINKNHLEYNNEYIIEIDETDSCNTNQIDDINNFLDTYTPDIHNLYEEIQKKFFCVSPAFLCKMQFHNLVDFFINILFLPDHFLYEKSNFTLINRFQDLYITQLEISYNIIYNFLSCKFKYKLSSTDWIFFCYTMTDLYEIHK